MSLSHEHVGSKSYTPAKSARRYLLFGSAVHDMISRKSKFCRFRRCNKQPIYPGVDDFHVWTFSSVLRSLFCVCTSNFLNTQFNNSTHNVHYLIPLFCRNKKKQNLIKMIDQKLKGHK